MKKKTHSVQPRLQLVKPSAHTPFAEPGDFQSECTGPRQPRSLNHTSRLTPDEGGFALSRCNQAQTTHRPDTITLPWFTSVLGSDEGLVNCRK